MPPNIIHEGLMTQRTRLRLESELQNLKAQAAQNQIDAGATIESAQDWHDNGAYDRLQEQLQVIVTMHDQVERRLKNAKIIQRRTDTSRVGIGNTVVVKYEGEDDTEKFTILGIPDTDTEKTWISAASPLGSALLEKIAGNVITLPSNIKVTLLQILAGEF